MLSQEMMVYEDEEIKLVGTIAETREQVNYREKIIELFKTFSSLTGMKFSKIM
jgi:hypothetical protein